MENKLELTWYGRSLSNLAHEVGETALLHGVKNQNLETGILAKLGKKNNCYRILYCLINKRIDFALLYVNHNTKNDLCRLK